MAAGHPWVRREDLSRFAPPPEAGTLVRLQDSMGNFLGHAVSDGPTAATPYRVLSRSRHPEFNAAYFATVIERTLIKREAASRQLQRLIHGEADELPGVFCDRAGDNLLLRYQSPGMLAFAGFIEKALLAKLKPKILWKKTDGPWQQIHGTSAKRNFSAARAGLTFMVRLDDPEGPCDFNMESSADFERLTQWKLGPEALVVFSRRGAWAAALAVAGAKNILCLEREKTQVAYAKENLALNSFAQSSIEHEEGDAFSRLDTLLQTKRQFQCVVVEAPAQSKSAHGRFNAAKQLPNLAARALKLVEPGGVAVISLRSGLISPATFLGAINQGASEAACKLEILAAHEFPKDMPAMEGFPEGQSRLCQAWRVTKP